MRLILNNEQNYLNLLNEILTTGSDRQDRTGIGTKSLFGKSLRFSLENNTLPLLTTKKMYTKGIIEELLFFIRGETNSKKLEEKNVNIWKGNTSKEFLSKRGLDYPEGEMGKMYGYQWRKFGEDESSKGVDQLKNALDLIKNDPFSRRIVVSAFNPKQAHLGVLEPCHMFFQFYVNNGELSCQYTCRSTDMFLGNFFNITSYSILTHLFAKAANLKAKELIFVGGDVHIYNNHINQVKEQLSRTPYNFPTININKSISSIEDMENLSYEDFEVLNYKFHPAIKAEMAI